MIRFLSLFLLSGILVFSGCAPVPQKPDTALTKYYPNMKYQQINPTPITGLYEVIAENNEVMYFAPASGHMFFGEIWSADAHNLTRESKNRRMSTKLNLFPLGQAIRIGNGPNQVIEVTDPDCPFCRQSSDFFAGRDDVTRYIFLFPLDQLHPNSAAKARFILAAKDQETAYEEVFNGKYDSRPIPAANDNGQLEKHRNVVHRVGVTSTPQFWINGQHVAGFNPLQFEELLNK